MGAFDWPGPLFARLDALIDFLPPALKLALWAVIGAGLSMAIYKAVSPQRRVALAKAEAKAMRRRLDNHDGDLSGAWPLMGRAIAAALRPIRLELPPALAASLPLLAMIAWLSTAYGYRFPDIESPVAIAVTPPQFKAQLLQEKPHSTEASPVRRLLVTDPSGATATEIALRAPVSTLEKRRWWHFLIGNPAGYLPDGSAVERIELSLPAQEVLPVGPTWLRGWEPLYFAVLILCSLAIKRLWKIA
jgi:hypothetical protein